MGGCQNYGPFLGTLNIRCRIIVGIQKRTILLTTTHIGSQSLFRAPAQSIIPTLGPKAYNSYDLHWAIWSLRVRGYVHT